MIPLSTSYQHYYPNCFSFVCSRRDESARKRFLKSSTNSSPTSSKACLRLVEHVISRPPFSRSHPSHLQPTRTPVSHLCPSQPLPPQAIPLQNPNRHLPPPQLRASRHPPPSPLLAAAYAGSTSCSLSSSFVMWMACSGASGWWTR